MTDEGWQRVLRVIEEAFGSYLSGMVALRKRVVMDLKRKLSDGDLLDRPHLEQSRPREQPAAPVRRRRARGRRNRRS